MARNEGARLHDVFHKHERAVRILDGGEDDVLRQRLARAFDGIAQALFHQRIVFCGEEIDAAFGFAADLRDLKSRVADGTCDGRVIQLRDRHHHGVEPAFLERGEPFLLRNTGEVFHQLDVVPGGHDCDLLLRFLDPDPEDDKPDRRKCAHRGDQRIYTKRLSGICHINPHAF